MKIWFKLVKDDKIIKNYLYENNLIINRQNFEKTLRDICYNLDIGCPLILNSHYKHFKDFNISKFLASEFMEPIAYDYATAENIYEIKKS